MSDFFPEDPKKQRPFAMISFDAYVAMVAGYVMGNRGKELSKLSGLVNNPKFDKTLRKMVLRSNRVLGPVESAEDYLRGDLDFLIGWGYGVVDANAKEEVWKGYYPKDGHLGWLDSWMVSKGAQDRGMRDISEAFINYTIGEKFQERMYPLLGAEPVTKGARAKVVERAKTQTLERQLAYGIKALKERVYIGDMQRRHRNYFIKKLEEYGAEKKKMMEEGGTNTN